MATALEDLKILQIAEHVADEIWKLVITWDVFVRDVVGGQWPQILITNLANSSPSPS
jgi:hypothetical protein